MLTIRLQRIGRKNEPAFRMVVTERKNAAQSGKFLEILGTHTVKSDAVVLKADRIKYWMSNGAQVSPTAHNMLIKEGIITDAKKKNVLSKKTPTQKRKALKQK